MSFDLPHWPATNLPAETGASSRPTDYFERLVADAATADGGLSVGRVLLITSTAIGMVAFILTATAFAGDDGSGLAGMILFLTGPMFIVSFLLGIPATFLVLRESPGTASPLAEILHASNGR